MSKPRISSEDLKKMIKKTGLPMPTTKVFLAGIRGYYLDSMGVKGKNDRGIYDDALIWVTPNGIFSFNANVDPSAYRKGTGKGSTKGMASLNCGIWLYQMGMHNGSAPHPAFRQAASVVVTRDGVDAFYEDTGMFGINIHRGGNTGTSSLGCQTIPPKQWDSFKELGYSELKRAGQKKFFYILLENK